MRTGANAAVQLVPGDFSAGYVKIILVVPSDIAQKQHMIQ
jgi:hypothetical protein